MCGDGRSGIEVIVGLRLDRHVRLDALPLGVEVGNVSRVSFFYFASFA